MERAPEHIRAQYLLERGLADRLRQASREDRPAAYAHLYDELFRQVPDHPQFSVDRAERERVVQDRLCLVSRFCTPQTRLLEIGAGDCAFPAAAAGRVANVIAAEVSAVISTVHDQGDFERLLSNGITFPIPDSSIDVAFSDQLLEHLHPDDALAQLEDVRRVLTPSGVYICITPNRVTGPHDISGRFDDVPRGMHLREYSSSELRSLFRLAGFARVRFFVGGRGRYVPVPAALLTVGEAAYSLLPRRVRKRLRTSPVAVVLGLVAIASP